VEKAELVTVAKASGNLGLGKNLGYMIVEQPFSELEYLLPATDMQCSFSCYEIL
jgi:hypothetical protein